MPGRYYPSGSHPRYSGSNQRSGGGGPSSTTAASETGGGGNASTGNANTSNNAPNSNSNSQQQLSPESLALARLRQKSISHPLQTCQLTVYVPPHTVGAVIGRGGRTILNVQREAMRRSAGHVAPVRISVLGGSSSSSSGNANANSSNAENASAKQQQEGVGDKHQGDSFSASTSKGGGSSTWNYNEYLTQQQQQNQQQQQRDDTEGDSTKEEEDDWTPVIIRGDPVGCMSAVRQILPLVDRDHDPDIIFEVPIHRAKHNMLVGKGGIILAALSATYETRIMIPPNEFMSNVDVGGGENFWQKRQAHQQQDAGSTMLFGGDTSGGKGGGGSHNNVMGSNANNPPVGQAGSTLPPNVIQLEGDIDKVEQCLVKMLSIVSGERWIPTGVIVEKTEEKGNKNSKSAPKTAPATDDPSKDSTAASSSGTKGSKDETTAEAVIVKIWTPSSKLLNLGKIRKVQRKTNTVIRRKKLRFTGNIVDGMSGGAAVAALVNEKEEDVDEDVEPSLVNEGDNDEEEGGKDVSGTGPRTATKYIITGKTESVKSAAAQFEKILGLDPGSSTITDTTNKTNSVVPHPSDNTAGGVDKVVNVVQQQQPGLKPEGESTEIAAGGPGGKKIRRKKKRGKGGNVPKNAKDSSGDKQGDV